jgi:Uma2 family endonuclease
MATVRLQFGPADNGRKMTLEEFWDAEDEPGYFFEVARGVLEVSETLSIFHFQIVHNLHQMFSEHIRRYPRLILRIGHGSDVRFIIPELETDRHPDLAIVFRGTAQRDFKGDKLPLLAVEVVSPGSRARKRDYEDKRVDYLAVGLLEYWIVDPEKRMVTVLVRRELDGVASWTERIFRDSDVSVGDLFPGFIGTVAELWANPDDED